MPVESDTDRLAVLEDWDTAVIGGNTIKGVFGAGYVADDVGEVPMSGSRPEFLCRSIDLPAITTGTTTATINAVVYVIMDVQPDGAGLTLLILRK